MMACYYGHTEILKALLAHPNVDVNTQQEDGFTAVMEASQNGHIEVVNFLLAHPLIDVNKQHSVSSVL